MRRTKYSNARIHIGRPCRGRRGRRCLGGNCPRGLNVVFEKLKGDGAAAAAAIVQVRGARRAADSRDRVGCTADEPARRHAGPRILRRFLRAGVRVPDVPFAQPRNVIVGLPELADRPRLPQRLRSALVVGRASRRHGDRRDDADPHRASARGSNPVIVYLQAGLGFPDLPDTRRRLVVIAVALIYNNATREARCPKYW